MRASEEIIIVLGKASTGAAQVFRPLAFTKAVPNTSLGATNVQAGATTHHVAYYDVTDGSFQVWYPNWGATAGSGEWNNGGSPATAKCSILWIDQSKVQQITTLAGATAAAGGWFKFYGPSVRPLVGSHFWLNFCCLNFPGGGYYSHGKADYLNGEGLVYGASGVSDLTGTSTAYGNTYAGANDYYGPDFIGGNRSGISGVSFVNDGDSREAGVLTTVLGDIADNLYGAYGTFGRLLIPYMPGINISIPGGTASEMSNPANTVNRDILAKICDYRSAGNGANDTIAQAATAAQVEAWEATRVARLGRSVNIYKTIDPETTSASVNTPASSGNDPNRRTLNTFLRTVAGTYDSASILESGSTGTWNSLTYTTDGVHESAVGNKAALSGLSGYSVPTNFPSATLLNAGFQYANGAGYQSLGFTDSWTATDVTNSAAAIYSPEHKFTGGVLKEDATASANHRIFKQVTLALASTTKTCTMFVKRSVGSRNFFFRFQESGGFTDGRIQVNLGTGAIINSQGNFSTITVSGTPTVTVYDDYYKIQIAFACAAGVAANPYIYMSMADASGNDSYSGDNTSSIAIWGLDIR